MVSFASRVPSAGSFKPIPITLYDALTEDHDKNPTNLSNAAKKYGIKLKEKKSITGAKELKPD